MGHMQQEHSDVPRSFTPMLVVLAMLLPALLGACAPSAWEKNFVPEGGGGGGSLIQPLAKGQAVRSREVPFDRLGQALVELEQRSAASPVHRSEWSADTKRDVKARLLSALQVSEDPARVEIVGSANFRTTDPLRPESDDAGSLADTARKFGATDALWARKYLGKADRIVEAPVTTNSTVWGGSGNWGGRRGENDRWGGGPYSENSTSWVPVRVQADEWQFLVYFVRIE